MKKGISLVMLAITVVVISILAAVVVLSGGDTLNDVNYKTFNINMSEIQDKVSSYYIMQGTLPKKSGTQAMTTVEMLNDVNNEFVLNFAEEINKNGDGDTVFYYIDVDKLAIDTELEELNIIPDYLVVNEEGTRIYYIKGYRVGQEIYFGVDTNN